MEPQSQPLDDELSRTLAIRERYKVFLTKHLGRRKSPVRIVIGLFLCISLVLVPLGLILIYQGLRGVSPNRRRLEEELEFVDRAHAVMAAPLMFNSALGSQGDRPAPGLFIVTFDPGAPRSTAYFAEVALAVMECGTPQMTESDKKFLADLMGDEQVQRHRRRRLPTSITRGHTVYACDLMVPPYYLPNRQINEEMPFVPCLAEPGDAGDIRVIPYWCAFDVTPPPWEENCKVALM